MFKDLSVMCVSGTSEGEYPNNEDWIEYLDSLTENYESILFESHSNTTSPPSSGNYDHNAYDQKQRPPCSNMSHHLEPKRCSDVLIDFKRPECNKGVLCCLIPNIRYMDENVDVATFITSLPDPRALEGLKIHHTDDRDGFELHQYENSPTLSMNAQDIMSVVTSTVGDLVLEVGMPMDQAEIYCHQFWSQYELAANRSMNAAEPSKSTVTKFEYPDGRLARHRGFGNSPDAIRRFARPIQVNWLDKTTTTIIIVGWRVILEPTGDASNSYQKTPQKTSWQDELRPHIPTGQSRRSTVDPPFNVPSSSSARAPDPSTFPVPLVHPPGVPSVDVSSTAGTASPAAVPAPTSTSNTVDFENFLVNQLPHFPPRNTNELADDLQVMDDLLHGSYVSRDQHRHYSRKLMEMAEVAKAETMDEETQEFKRKAESDNEDDEGDDGNEDEEESNDQTYFA